MNTPNVIKFWIRLALLISALLLPARAWVQSASNAIWPDGTVPLVIQLGETPTYVSGLTPNGVGTAAAQKWNVYMQRVQVTVSTGATGPGASRNGLNEVYFGSGYDGSSFQTSVLGVTLSRYTGTRRVESDIVINDSKNWGNYTGGHVSNNPDLSRVIIHEVGHVLGLGHPDENGQNYTALMNSHVSHLSDPITDDIEGIATLYGSAPGSAPVPPVITWTTGSKTLEEKQTFELTVRGLEAASYACQWYKDGIAIPGATGASYKVTSAVLADSGTYHLEVRGVSGSARSANIQVTVTVRTPPTVKIANFTGASFYLTTGIQLYAEVKGSTPMTLQWQKDGVNIPGATEYYYMFVANTLADAGDYRVVATNDVGSAVSASVRCDVKAVHAPVFPDTFSKVVTLQEGVGTSMWPWTDSPVDVSWEWFFEGVKLANTGSLISFKGLETEAGLYTMKATNIGGSTSFDFRLVIVPLPPIPSFVISPVSSSLKPGTNLMLSTTSNLSNEYYYQWYKDGVALVGKTASILSLTNIKSSDAGDYYLVVKTPGGITTSQSASLKVEAGTEGSVATPAKTVCFGGVVYYLQASPAAVQRFDLASGAPLGALPLPEAVTQFCVGSAGVFVALSSGEIWRCSPGATAFEAFYTTPSGVVLMATTGDQLFWLGKSYGQLFCLEISTKAVLSGASNNGFNYNLELLVSEKNKRLYLFNGSANGQAFNVLRYAIENTGLQLQNGYSSEVVGPRLLLNRAETFFVDSGGNCVDAVKLTRIGALGVRLDSFAELPEGASIVLSGGRVHFCGANFTPQRSMPAPSGAVALFSQAEKCYVMKQSVSSGVSFSVLDQSQLTELMGTSPSLDATGIPLPPDALLLDKDGLLWTMSRGLRSLVAWSPETRRVVKAIRLRACANFAAYSSENHSIYLSYADGLITAVDLSKLSVSEKVFASSSEAIVSLGTLGEFVLMQRGKSGAVTYIYDAQGVCRSVNTGLPFSAEFAWDPVSKQTYAGSSLTTPEWGYKYVFDRTGQLSTAKLMPGGRTVQYPLRLGGGALLTGWGDRIDLDTLTLLGTLPERHIDAVWQGGHWYTVMDSIDGSVVKRYDSAAANVEKTALGLGRAKRLFALAGNRVLLVSERYGVQRYTIFDADLKQLSVDSISKPNRLANISVQADAEQGLNALVPGFVINGTSPKTLLLRGCGPGLAAFGVAGCLADPTITLYDKDGREIANNDDWGSLSNLREVRERSSDLYAFKLPTGSKDAVILVRLNPGLYSAQVQGNANGVGRTLVEVYDAEEAPGDARAVNMSARCKISKGHEAVGGFVVQGDKPKKMLIRAIGPGLLQWSVKGASADPKLRVFSGTTVIAENNDWSADASKVAALKTAFAATGAFALEQGSKDAALLVELQPGDYTLYMESADGGSGVGLMELYEVE